MYILPIKSVLSLGQDEIAKYPFLADAGKYLSDKGFTLDQFGSDPDLKPILEKSMYRIDVAINGNDIFSICFQILVGIKRDV